MAYLTSLLIMAGAVLVLVVLLVRLIGPVRRLSRAAQDGRGAVTDRTGLLSARSAALRIELERRRSRKA